MNGSVRQRVILGGLLGGAATAALALSVRKLLYTCVTVPSSTSATQLLEVTYG